MNINDLSIDYSLIADSIDFYKIKGYEYVEVPWIVEPKYSLMTNNNITKIFDLSDLRHLVGSGEQGFLKQILEYKIDHNKKYMTVTPCFRKYDNDRTHLETFIKLELFHSFGILDMNSLITTMWDNMTFKMCDDALENFINLSNKNFIAYVTFNNFDLTVPGIEIASKDIEDQNGLEMGSYGYRYFEISSKKYLVYEYGTGIALPRFQMT